MKRVLLIGLDPAVVDYGRWPGLDAEKLERALRSETESVEREGYEARLRLVDHGETAASTVSEALADGTWDCVLIGAGVRTDENEFALFETLVNVVHREAPNASICFNTGPTDSLAAVRRWT